ncbi:unnamed protein product [Diplocarpon coronariae]
MALIIRQLPKGITSFPPIDEDASAFNRFTLAASAKESSEEEDTPS